MEQQIDLSKYRNVLTRKHQMIRMLWSVVWTIFARPLPRSIGSGWKRFLLRLFGAKLASTAIVYSSAKIYYPANLIMDEYSCLASGVDSLNPLVTAPIIVKDQAWIATDAFVGMGVTVGQGAVIGARACVFKDVEPWTVVGGNPAKFIKKRVIS